jgi:hypothetical protein
MELLGHNQSVSWLDRGGKAAQAASTFEHLVLLTYCTVSQDLSYTKEHLSHRTASTMRAWAWGHACTLLGIELDFN